MLDDFDPKRRLVATLGRFTVHYDPLVHLPWGLYRIFSSGKYIGAQISFPCKSDCEFLTHRSAPVVITSHVRGDSNDYYLRGGSRHQWRKRQQKRAA